LAEPALRRDGRKHGVSHHEGQAAVSPIHFNNAVPVLASLNIERSVVFFCEARGFRRIFVDPGVYGIVKAHEVEIHFWACAEKRIAENTGCRVNVEGIEALYEQVLPSGCVHPNAPLTKKSWGTCEFAILEPDGNLVTFFERESVG
jgi:hypothetical protein